MREAVFVTAVRTPVGRAHKGKLKDTRPDDLGGLILRAALERTPGLEPGRISDVLMGNAHPEGEAGYNLARIALQIAEFPETVAGATINRFCASGLQTMVQGAHAVACGMSEVVFAGGSDCTSRVPMGGHTMSINKRLYKRHPEAYHTMGQTAEAVARKFGITREEQDVFALRSHQKAVAARAAGRFDEQLVPVATRVQDEAGAWHEVTLEHDEGPRADTSLERLAGLKTVFADDDAATVTAGNSSPLNDGAAMTVVMPEEDARALGLKPLAKLVQAAVVGVPPEIMGVGPVPAIRALLQKTGMTVADVDLFEINEAFASQCFYSQRELGIPDEKLNVNGGAIAIGHPLGATGARIAADLFAEMGRRGAEYGVISMCVGGGQGMAALFKRV
ncbi:thiolase family protein [Truepera radiovictrix]|uniref:acetyl-CoA C-acyltransferase n=1 Tax=Truepera radiovictrix (strain DSM 17093 / CIP 108686 / LMG 22925 / RQ-24) TaxID=649638 RepID=D7CV46_TRURR|nr:thiolase family protein [Truepera radiovictrix]ADI15873.1 acetyl-CoA acetyltransferase [Truepera radiovictrix DSM 17093]WMT58501.1 thiolase family protein [Truepera radiovictrix]